jgi:hypothetical protein
MPYPGLIILFRYDNVLTDNSFTEDRTEDPKDRPQGKPVC